MKQAKTIILLTSSFALLALASAARAGYIPVYGGPVYDAATGTGLRWADACIVSEAGTAVVTGVKFVGGGPGTRCAWRWDPWGALPAELGILTLDPSGQASAHAYAINSAGTVVGTAAKYISGSPMGWRAVRWDASGTVATELGNLGTDASGVTSAQARGINSAGTAVGSAFKYVGGADMGSRAVRWDASGTAATELGDIGTDAAGQTRAWAFAINGAGTAVGSAFKYVAGAYMGSRAVRWDSSGTAATELGHLGTDPSGSTLAEALHINAAGRAVGRAYKYVDGTRVGDVAVRWEATGTAATELGNLGTDASGQASAYPYGINDAGTAVGGSSKYVGGADMGVRAVRWDASGTAATELGNLGTDASGYTKAWAEALNNAGTAVGFARLYVGGTYIGQRAVYWGLDGAAVDLNDLIDPSGGWTLNYAQDISDTDWITGYGSFDPDGPGGLGAYQRGFLMQIPEPCTLGLLSAAALAAMLSRRRFAG